jgi:hypothetical protein
MTLFFKQAHPDDIRQIQFFKFATRLQLINQTSASWLAKEILQ